MKRVNNKFIFILGLIFGLIISITTVYAIDAYIESNKVSYDNHNEKITKKNNVQDSIDELYERSGIHKEKWIDPILNGADPILTEPLIPVEIEPNGDVYYANENSEWYNYSEKRWANAVILVDEPTKEYTVGAKIEENDIESYFVWIPRYQYKVWDLGNYERVLTLDDLTNNKTTSGTDANAFWKIAGSNVKLIDIKFGIPKDIPKMTEPSATGVYYTHPAFTLGNKDLNGIWVGKFETGGTTDSPIVKPNVTSLRNQTVKAFFETGYNYEQELDSHMMKNTEWGAVAYLSHSEYGIGNEVKINNTEDFYTGYATAPNLDRDSRSSTYSIHSDNTKTKPWNTPVGSLASTTGNISGVYDMSGGAWEYVAAYRQNSAEIAKSGFTATEITQQISAGYIDSYAADSSTTSYNKRILGDATGEMGPFYQYYDKDGAARYHNSWYGNHSSFVDSANSWFTRSGGFDYGGLASQFFFLSYSGDAYEYISFRLVLSPIK